MEIHSTSQLQSWTFRRVVWTTLVLAGVALGFWLLFRFYQVIFIIFIAIVIGTLFRPLVNWLYRRGLPRITGVIILYLLLLALFIGFLLLLFPLLIDEGTAIIAAVPDYYQSVREWMSNSNNQLILRLGDFLPAALPGLVPKAQTGEETLASAEQALGFIAAAANIVFLTVAILLLALHWTLDGSRTIQSLLQLVPKNHREGISVLVSAMETKVAFSIAGQSVLCVIVGIMALVVYLILGLPNALVLALVAGVMEAVPMVGPLIGAIPAAVVAFSISPGKLVWVIIGSIVIQQLENNLLVPRVMRKAVGVNPFVSLLSIFAFSSIFGIAGALMAIPIAAIIQLLLNHFIFHPETSQPDTASGRDHASRLRYEAQDLVQDLRKQARLKKGGSASRVRQIDLVMDEIETITTDLDALLAQAHPSQAP